VDVIVQGMAHAMCTAGGILTNVFGQSIAFPLF
jgi:hypothetical protein